MSDMPCVVVSGSRGLLGATLMRVLPDAGFRAVPLTCDIRDAAAVTKQIAQAAPAHVVHAAAMTYVAACMRQPQEAFAVNSQGTKNVVEAARAASARILYISTASVFRGDHGDCREDDAPEPTNAYNQSKREGEWHTLDYDGGVVLRFNLIGIHPDGSRSKNFFEWLVDGFRANKEMTLVCRRLHQSAIQLDRRDAGSEDSDARSLSQNSPYWQQRRAVQGRHRRTGARAVPQLSQHLAVGQCRRHRRRHIPAETDVAQHRQSGRAPWPDADRSAGA
jgi:RmlD substrate binding domain